MSIEIGDLVREARRGSPLQHAGELGLVVEVEVWGQGPGASYYVMWGGDPNRITYHGGLFLIIVSKGSG